LRQDLLARTPSDLGDEKDRCGGTGRNGAQNTPEAEFAKLLPIVGAHFFKLGKLFKLEASSFIKDDGTLLALKCCPLSAQVHQGWGIERILAGF